MRESAVPSEFFEANRRAVVRAHNPVLQFLEMRAAREVRLPFTPRFERMRIGYQGQEFALLFTRGIDESRIVTAHALTVNVCKSSDEGTLRFGCFGTHQQIQKAIYQSFFRSRRFGSRDDQFAQDNQSFIL